MIAEQDDEPVPVHAASEPAPEHRKIIAQAVQIFGRKPAPVGLTPDLPHNCGGNAGKGAGIVPIGKVGRYRRERNVARYQDQLSEYWRCGAEPQAYRRCTIECELIRDREPAE